jgi:hypothetical protein
VTKFTERLAKEVKHGQSKERQQQRSFKEEHVWPKEMRSSMNGQPAGEESVFDTLAESIMTAEELLHCSEAVLVAQHRVMARALECWKMVMRQTSAEVLLGMCGVERSREALLIMEATITGLKIAFSQVSNEPHNLMRRQCIALNWKVNMMVFDWFLEAITHDIARTYHGPEEMKASMFGGFKRFVQPVITNTGEEELDEESSVEEPESKPAEGVFSNLKASLGNLANPQLVLNDIEKVLTEQRTAFREEMQETVQEMRKETTSDLSQLIDQFAKRMTTMIGEAQDRMDTSKDGLLDGIMRIVGEFSTKLSKLVVDFILAAFLLKLVYDLCDEWSTIKATLAVALLTYYVVRHGLLQLCATKFAEIVQWLQKGPKEQEEQFPVKEMRASGFSTILSAVSYIVAGGLAVASTNEAPPGKWWHSMSLAIGAFPRTQQGTTSILKWIVEKLKDVLNVVLRWYGFDEIRETESGIKKLDDWVVKAKALVDGWNEQVLLLDGDNKIQLDEVIREGKEMYGIFRTEPDKSIANKVLDVWLKPLEGEIRRCFTDAGLDAQGHRVEPVVVNIVGLPGVGKSSLTHSLACEILLWTYRNDPLKLQILKDSPTSLIYDRKIAQQYWDGFGNQKVIIYDDHGQLRDVAGQPDNEYTEIISLKNTTPFGLHMAAMENKGVKFASPVALLLTSNSAGVINCNSITTPEALFRRYDIKVLCYPADEYCIRDAQGQLPEDPANRRLDMTKVPSTKDALGELVVPWNSGVYRFDDAREYKTTSGKTEKRKEFAGLRYDQLLDMIRVKLDDFAKRQKAYKESFTDDFRSRVERRIGELSGGRHGDMHSLDYIRKAAEEERKRKGTMKASSSDGKMPDISEERKGKEKCDFTTEHLPEISDLMALYNLDMVTASQLLREAGSETNRACSIYEQRDEIDHFIGMTGLSRTEVLAIFDENNWKYDRVIRWWTETKRDMPTKWEEFRKARPVMEAAKKPKITLQDLTLESVMAAAVEQEAVPETTRLEFSRQEYLVNIIQSLHPTWPEHVCYGVARQYFAVAETIAPMEGAIWAKFIAGIKAQSDQHWRMYMRANPIDTKFVASSTWETFKAGFSAAVAAFQAVHNWVWVNIQNIMLAAIAAFYILMILMIVTAWWSSGEKKPSKKKMEASSVRDQRTKAPRKPRPRETNREFRPSGGDTTGYDIANSVFYNNLYTLHTDPAEEPLSNVLFIGGRVALVNSHVVRWMQACTVEKADDLDEMHTLVIDDAIYLRSAAQPAGNFLPFALRDLYAGRKLDNSDQHCDVWMFEVKAVTVPMRPWIVDKFIPGLRAPRQQQVHVLVTGYRSGVRLDHQGVGMVQRDVRITNDENGEKYTLNRCIQYVAQFGRGFCGSPCYILDPASGKHKIVGIHASDIDGIGASVIVEQEQLNRALKESFSQADVLIVPDKPMSSSMRSPCPVHVPCHQDRPVFMNRSSEIVRSELPTFETFELKTAPAALVPFVKDGVRIDPYLVGINRYCRAPLPVETFEVYRLAASHTLKNITRASSLALRRDVVQMYAFRQAVEGIPGCHEFRALPRRTSAGYPMALDTGGKPGKTLWLGTEGEIDFSTPEIQKLEEEVMHLATLARQGVVTEHIFQSDLKDERRALKKVANGETRIIFPCPLKLTILHRMFFGDFSRAMLERKIANNCTIGVNVYSLDWDRIAKKHHEAAPNTEPCTDDSDVKSCDASFQPVAQDIIRQEIVERYYELGRFSVLQRTDLSPKERLEIEKDYQECARARRVLWQPILHPEYIHRDTVLRMDVGNPSGWFLTALSTSLHIETSSRSAFAVQSVRHGSSVDPFDGYDELVRIDTNGDDAITTASPLVHSFFSPASIAEYFTVLGMTLTSSDKSGAIGVFKPLTECIYLKRGFRWERMLERYVAPLALDTILEMSLWTKKGSMGRQICQDTFTHAVLELSLHDPKVWDEWFPRMAKSYYLAFHEHYPAQRAQALQKAIRLELFS